MTTENITSDPNLINQLVSEKEHDPPYDIEELYNILFDLAFTHGINVARQVVVIISAQNRDYFIQLHQKNQHDQS